MATPPRGWRWSKLHQVTFTLTLGHSNSSHVAGEGVYLEEEFPHLNFLILKQIFNTERDFTWQCIFHGHLEDTSQHPFTPSPVRTKDGFAASRMCWYFTKIDTKIGVLMIHQNGDSTISSQHLKRNKARLKTPSTASKQVCHLLSFPWKLSFARLGCVKRIKPRVDGQNLLFSGCEHWKLPDTQM